MGEFTHHEVHRRAKRIVLETLERLGDEPTLLGKKVRDSQHKKHDGWVLGAADQIAAPGVEYFFVSVPHDDREPAVYRMPSEEVARWLNEDHAAWLSRPGRYGQKHRDNPVRRLVNRDGWMNPYLVR